MRAQPAPTRAGSALRGALLGALGGLLVLMLGIAGDLGLHQTQLVVPAGGLIGGLAGWLGYELWAVGVATALLVLVFLIAFIPWTGLMDRWVRSDPLPEGGVGAIVVLASGVSKDSMIVGDGADRLLTGLELFRAGVAPRLVTTRYVRHYGSVRAVTDADQRRLAHLAGADSALMIVDSVGVTRDEATGAAGLLFPLGVREIALVTSPSHTRRACATFEKVGFVVRCRPALERDRRTWLAATAEERLSVFRAITYELLGVVKYRALGWI